MNETKICRNCGYRLSGRKSVPHSFSDKPEQPIQKKKTDRKPEQPEPTMRDDLIQRLKGAKWLL